MLDHCVEMGNPHDARMLAPAIARIKNLFAKAPKNATADRGYGEAKVEAELESLGVKYVAIPRKGRPGAQRQGVESSRRFRKLVKWRTGSEGRISYLKHSWGWERTMLDGINGARTWCGWGILAHNATKIAVLADEREMKSTVATTAENGRRPPKDHPDDPRRSPRRPRPDPASSLSRRAPNPETSGKWGQKRPERPEREPMGHLSGH